MRRTVLLGLAELALVILIFAGANIYHVVPISETPWLFILGWLSLRRRGLRWSSLGLKRPASRTRTLGIALGSAVFLQLFSTFVTDPLMIRLTGHSSDLTMFEPLVGNVKWLLLGLGAVWTLAAFGEEMVYRGYVLNRAADLGSGNPAAWAVGLVSVSLLFGLGHLYQGGTGVVDTTVTGLALGGLYLASGRNLWLPILTHGLTDTIALVLVFLDLVPQVHG